MFVFSTQPRLFLLSSANLSLILVLLSLPAPSTAAFQNDFSDYPSGTQSCLNDASNSSDCTGDTSAQMNQCLCSNGGNFVTNSAQCIAQNDSPDLESTWEIMELHCSDSNTPLSISKAQFMAYQSSVSSSSSAKSTATSTPTSTGTSTLTGSQQTVTATATATSTPDPGLSTGAKIGIIAGAAVAAAALLAAALFFFIRHRKRRQHEYREVHPMLAANAPHAPPPGGPRPGDSSAHPSHMSTGPSELESAVSTMGSPNNRNTWQSSSDGSSVPWSPGAFEAVKVTQVHSSHQPPLREEVYEMPADSAAPVSPSSNAAEMPAIAVTSPTISPTSRHSGVDWIPEASEPRRYEPFRPRRGT